MIKNKKYENCKNTHTHTKKNQINEMYTKQTYKWKNINFQIKKKQLFHCPKPLNSVFSGTFRRYFGRISWKSSVKPSMV